MSLLKVSPYISWKGTSTNSIAPSNSCQPINASGPPFKAQPINHWRKQLIPTETSGSRNRRAGVGMPMDKPGGSVYLGNVAENTNCFLNAVDTPAAGLKETIEKYNDTNFTYRAVDCFYDASANKMVRLACNPENNRIRSATTLLSKKYYTDRKSYMRSRCMLYDQKLTANLIQGSPDEYVRHTQNCCAVTAAAAAASCQTIYKPNNAQYAQQGAVDSSTRLTRLKLNTVNKNAASYKDTFGTTAPRYLGMATTPYFLKSKYEPPKCDCNPNPPSCSYLMDTTGLTRLTTLDDEDDVSDNFPVNFDFYFFGTNYGNGENEGIYWSTNSVLGFGPETDDIIWDPDTGLGILLGNADRRNNAFWYSPTLTTTSGANYVRLLYFGQNKFNDGKPNVLQYEMNIIRDVSNSFQYVEIKTAGVGSNQGFWNITDGTTFQNTCGDFQATGPVKCGSYVFRSDLNGENWDFFPNSHVDK